MWLSNQSTSRSDCSNTDNASLNELTIWQISGNSFEELPSNRHGIFYSAEGNTTVILDTQKARCPIPTSSNILNDLPFVCP